MKHVIPEELVNAPVEVLRARTSDHIHLTGGAAGEAELQNLSYLPPNEEIASLFPSNTSSVPRAKPRMPLRNFVIFNSVEHRIKIPDAFCAGLVLEQLQLREKRWLAQSFNLGINELFHFTLNGRGWVCHHDGAFLQLVLYRTLFYLVFRWEIVSCEHS